MSDRKAIETDNSLGSHRIIRAYQAGIRARFEHGASGRW